MKHKRTRSEIIYEVALGGISSAMALLFVWLSVVVPYGTIAFYVTACIALLAPLTQRYYFATVSAYVVSSLLAFAIVGDILLISGYVVYFAPMSIMSGIMLEKKVKPYISIPVKAVFIGLALAFLFYIAGTIMVSQKIANELPFWAVELVGIPVLFGIDFLMGYVYGAVKKKVSAVIRKRAKQEVENDSDDVEDQLSDNPFDIDEGDFELSSNTSVDSTLQEGIEEMNEEKIDVDNEG